MHRGAATGVPHAREAMPWRCHGLIRQVRGRRAVAKRKLQAFREAAAEASASRRTDVGQAIDDLDRAADEAAAEFD
jgi:hypothetical protein